MIDVYVLNTNFEIVGVIDSYESFIWTDRWNSYGDFELFTSFDYSLITLCQQGYYMHINQSEHTMIIEGIQVETDSETGIKLRITGRSLESILERRIVWTQTTIGPTDDFEQGIEKLIKDAIGDMNSTPKHYPKPGIVRNGQLIKNVELSEARIIDNFVFKELDPVTEPEAYNHVHGIKLEKVQYTGDNLYEILTAMCEDVNNTIGWKITLDDDFNFVFHLYTGKDRSYQQTGYMKTMDTQFMPNKTYYELIDGEYVVTSDQTKQKNKDYYEVDPIVPYVIFSPSFDNIINTNYLDSTEGMKNVTLVAGEGEGGDRKTLTIGSETGLERRELFTDARDLRSEDYQKNYNDALRTRGINKLVEYSRMQSYEGEVEATRQFVFGKDFFMGDIVQMSNEYGINGAVRVVEWVMSDSTTGTEIYPTFDAVQIIDDTEYEEEGEE